MEEALKDPGKRHKFVYFVSSTQAACTFIFMCTYKIKINFIVFSLYV